MTSAEQAPPRADTSPPVRLPKGEIPSTWSRPAEQVSHAPIRAPRPLTSALIVVGGAIVGFGLAVWLSPARSVTPPPPPTTTTTTKEISMTMTSMT